MIRTLNPQSPPAPAGPPCQCQQTNGPRQLGDITATLTDAFSDWKTWALIAAAALALYFMLQSTPKAQEHAVERRKARARYKAELTRIRTA
jgi:hypothetical protein